jgi:hypothetical protein
MNRERFISLVKNPGLLKAEDTQLLEEIIKEYPYFQTAHLLAARCYKVTDSIYLQKQIKIAAAHITNRKVLYELIEHYKMPEPFAKEQQIAHQITEEIIQPLQPQIIEPEKQQDEVNIEQSLSQTNQLESEIQSVQEDLNPISENMGTTTVIAVPAQIDEANVPVKDEIDLMLDKEINLAAAESILLQELESKISGDEQSVAVADHSSKAQHEEEEIAYPENTQAETNQPEPEKLAAAQTDFVAWLKHFQANHPTTPEKQILPQEKQEETLIDKFIDKPVERVKPVKQEFYKPVNMAKQSVTDNDYFVTETLAKIYIKQGNLSKAIKVYQNLSLKNPEKNAIFATQIKILKEQLLNKSGK